jgi:hypothetical protein
MIVLVFHRRRRTRPEFPMTNLAACMGDGYSAGQAGQAQNHHKNPDGD